MDFLPIFSHLKGWLSHLPASAGIRAIHALVFLMHEDYPKMKHHIVTPEKNEHMSPKRDYFHWKFYLPTIDFQKSCWFLGGSVTKMACSQPILATPWGWKLPILEDQCMVYLPTSTFQRVLGGILRDGVFRHPKHHPWNAPLEDPGTFSWFFYGKLVDKYTIHWIFWGDDLGEWWRHDDVVEGN